MTVTGDRINWLTANGVCTRTDVTGEIVGSRCPDCGHTFVLHHGVDACAMCEMQALMREMRQAMKGRPA